MNRMNLLATIASAAIVLQPAFADEREEFREVVSIDYDTHNPCTGQKVSIKGDVIVTGWYKDVEDGYRFVGETNYTRLVASGRSSRAVHKVVGSKDDHLRATIDIPVERLIKQDAVFRGSEDTFKASFTFRFSVSFFGDKDVDLTSIRTVCVTPGATDSSRQ